MVIGKYPEPTARTLRHSKTCTEAEGGEIIFRYFLMRSKFDRLSLLSGCVHELVELASGNGGGFLQNDVPYL